jgi:hypothetical protein
MALSLTPIAKTVTFPFLKTARAVIFFRVVLFFSPPKSAMSRRQVSCAAVPPGDPFRSRIRTFSD